MFILMCYWIIAGFWFWIDGAGSTLQRYYPVKDLIFSFVVGGIMLPVKILFKITR